ncbi:uncharacterized protein FIESC28_05817 [Fusarium coffeatum]|uniref:Uncharacterized protein n=1 Tax=Fusarium coffeatum TaxID=231269 RepID=A0A366RRE5_9HYPO|nr:uncharacterized protein FIESC28_05817 [Fusarium coffeatum]RBR18895.1 hypothetical protein FIESC28_05817 [Fusarium coffeatum]
MSNKNENSASGISAQGDNLELNQQFKKLSINPHDAKFEQTAQDPDTVDVMPKEAKPDKGKEIAKAGPSDAQVSTPNIPEPQSRPGYSCQVIDYNPSMGWQPDADMFDPLPENYYEQATRPLPQVPEDSIGQNLASALENLNLHRISQEERVYIAQLFMKKPYADIKFELEKVGIVYDDLTSEDLCEIITIMTEAD